MNLVYVATLIAVCSSAKLDRTYLPPPSAETAGGIPGDIQAPLPRDYFQSERSGLPKGAFDNDFDGVVVEAAPGTRASRPGETGLGASRATYGSTHSKVGEAAFKTVNRQGFQTHSNGDTQTYNGQAGFQSFQNNQQGSHSDINKASQRPQSASDRASNIVRYQNEVRPESYNYGFETDNGITVAENGVTVDGIHAEGGYSYTGDDGKVYKVTYTAGEEGYKPIGDHLPTPPPIPDEILKSLEQNAKDEAAGVTDDGSYDAAKYNNGDDYTNSDNYNNKHNGIQSGFGHNLNTNAVGTVGTFINENNQAFGSLNANEQVTSSVLSQPSFYQFGFPEKPNPSQVGEISSSEDDFSRPIYLGPGQFNHASTSDFGIVKFYLPPSNDNMYKEIEGNSDQNGQQNFFNTQRKTESKFQSSHYTDKTLKQQLGGSQSYSQTSTINSNNKNNRNSINEFSSQNRKPMDDYSNNLNLNTTSDVQYQKQSNLHPDTLNNVQSTLEPQTELTTPFEDSPNFNNIKTIRPQGQYNQQNNEMILQTPTQESFQSVSTSDNQYFNPNDNRAQIIVSQNNDNDQFHPNVAQKSQYQGPDHSYYYNQPSKSFFTPNQFHRVTSPTSVSENSNFVDNFKNSNLQQSSNFQGSSKYTTEPPTISSGFSLVANNMQHQNPINFLDSSSVSQTERFGTYSPYPIPSLTVHMVPSPTIPTTQYDTIFPSRYTGITQASISRFPAVPQQIGNLGSFDKKDQVSASSPADFNQNFIQVTNANQAIPEYNKIDPQQQPSQQNNGEIYEYKKPAEILPTPKTEENSQQKKPTSETTDDFKQFGQKLRPSSLTQMPISQDSQNMNQNEVKTVPQQLQLQSQANPQLISPNLQSQLNQNNFRFESHSSSTNNQPISRPSDTSQTVNRKQTTQSTQITTGAFAENQAEANNNPFGFSSRIRPCCQGSRVPTLSVHDSRNEFQRPIQPSIETQLGTDTGNLELTSQNTNSKLDFKEEGHGVSEFTKFQGQQGLQATQITSQSPQVGVGENFGGPRKPPSFIETSGYHY